MRKLSLFDYVLQVYYILFKRTGLILCFALLPVLYFSAFFLPSFEKDLIEITSSEEKHDSLSTIFVGGNAVVVSFDREFNEQIISIQKNKKLSIEAIDKGLIIKNINFVKSNANPLPKNHSKKLQLKYSKNKKDYSPSFAFRNKNKILPEELGLFYNSELKAVLNLKKITQFLNSSLPALHSIPLILTKGKTFYFHVFLGEFSLLFGFYLRPPPLYL